MSTYKYKPYTRVKRSTPAEQRAIARSIHEADQRISANLKRAVLIACEQGTARIRYENKEFLLTAI